MTFNWRPWRRKPKPRQWGTVTKVGTGMTPLIGPLQDGEARPAEPSHSDAYKARMTHELTRSKKKRA